MQVFLSIWREFKRQKANLFFTVFFPAILVFILGTLLEQWNLAEYDISQIRAAYIAGEEYPAFELFLEELEQKKMLTVVRGETEKTALEKIGGDLAAVIVYDAQSGEIVLHQGSDKIVNRAIHIMLQSYSTMEKAVMLCYQNGIMVEMEAESTQQYVTAKKLGVQRSMMDYYAVCMLVMILFMGGSISGAACFYDFKQAGLFRRTAITPASKIKVFVQMLLGNLPMAAIEIGAIMLCSTFFFGAKYCVNFQGNVALILFFGIIALMTSAFGAIVGLLVRSNPVIVLMPLNWVMMFFGGTFAKEVYIEGISNRMPSYVIQQAAFDLTLFGNYERIFKTGGIIFLFLLLFVVLGAMLFCKKKNI